MYGDPGKGDDPGRQHSEVLPERGMKGGKTVIAKTLIGNAGCQHYAGSMRP